MSFCHSPAGADAAILTTVISGGAWTAARVRNPHLRFHCRALGRTFRPRQTALDPHRDPCIRLAVRMVQQSEILTRPHSLAADCVPSLVRVAAYAGQWLREPETWQPEPGLTPEAQWRDLLLHLFAAWPVPEFFHSAWRVRGALTCLERDWYCHLARGGSWRKAVGLPASISQRALHLASHAPAHLSVCQALRWGQVTAAGGSPALLDQVLASPMVADLENESVWSRLIAKSAAARDFEPREFGVIAEVLQVLMAHGHFKRAGLLVEQPLPELRRHCLRRWQKLLDGAVAAGLRFRDHDLLRPGLRAELRHFSDAVWEPMPAVSRFEVQRKEDREDPAWWIIHEQCSHAQLVVEGRELHHCVGGYLKKCLSGKSAIFSLWHARPDDPSPQARLTIEVDPNTRRIRQIRGRWNRLPSSFEIRLVEEWAASNQLNMAS